MKLKICGINDINILQYACDMGVDYVGFILANNSPRKISHDFLTSLENFNFKDASPVFVFVNPSVEEVEKVITQIKNPILQFHGDEGDAFCQQFNHPFWKTIRVKNSQSLKSINDFSSADAILLETFSDSSYGGTGKVFDWSLLNNISLEQGYVLAGGINSENIKKAVSMNPWCIDVNSGVESSLALKNKNLIAEIIKKFKNE